MPSKTAQTGLNFITKEDEKKLLQVKPSAVIITLIRMIYVILDQPQELIKEDDLINNFYNTLLPQYQTDNLSTLNLFRISFSWIYT